jgi:excinuclease UvrABC nuclease subunit
MTKRLTKQITKIPHKPGAYIFKDKSGRIVYIGKARDLKKRVQSHFSKKSAFYGIPFIDKVANIDWIKTRNESEAMLLEDQLIKKYKPRYNIQWKDDKSYFWVAFSNDEWPRIQIVHKSHAISNKFQPIGPFVNGRELRRVLRALRKIFPYRTCKNQYNKPCLQWHLGLCPAHGQELGIRNPQPRQAKRGGQESRIKKYLNSLNALSQFLRLYAGEPIRIEAYDISNIQGNYATGSMIVFYGNKPSKSDYRKFRIKTVRGANDIAMLKEVLRRRLNHREWPYPDLMLIDGGLAQLRAARFMIYDSKFIIPVIALAKKEEEIYTEYSQKPLKITSLPESLKLAFQHIRNEAHRFAIFYYRYLHEARDFRRISKTRRKKS